ncbi:MAG: FAD-dependent thymidylate synthase [Candidatus Brocadiia bacterium]
MNVTLLQHTKDPERAIALAARLCYSNVGIKELKDHISAPQTGKLVQMLVRMGHHSALEHASFTFGVEGVSRSLTHQLVRHRLASYSQQSQRYVKAESFEYIVPPEIKSDPALNKVFIQTMNGIQKIYNLFTSKGIAAEDARYVLPNATETKIIVTMNARELLHFCLLRCCNRAHWEIHQLADGMLKQAKAVASNVFETAGPACVADKCHEGKMSCGKAAEVRRKYQLL